MTGTDYMKNFIRPNKNNILNIINNLKIQDLNDKNNKNNWSNCNRITEFIPAINNVTDQFSNLNYNNNLDFDIIENLKTGVFGLINIFCNAYSTLKLNYSNLKNEYIALKEKFDKLKNMH